MRLSTKLGLSVAVVVVLYSALHAAVQRGVVYPSFEALETRRAAEDLRRVQETLASEVEHVDSLCHEWARSPDVQLFVEGLSPRFAEDNLTQRALEGAELFLVYVADRDGRVRAREFRSSEPGAAEPEIADCPPHWRSPTHPLQALRDPRARVAGLLGASCGALLFSSRPILADDERHTPLGTLLVARLLDDAYMRQIARQTRLVFSAQILRGASLAPAEERAIAQLCRDGDVVTQEEDETQLACFGLARDYRGEPLALLRTSSSREISSEGRRALGFALGSTLAASALVLTVIVLVLQRQVVAPLGRLAAHAVRLGKDGDLAARLSDERDDEIGVLSREIDSMVEKLAESRARLVRTAHLAGMSEVATEVLHNVGNVLNSANVAAEQVELQVAQSRSGDVSRIARLLEEHEHDLAEYLTRDERGRALPTFLGLLASTLESERTRLRTECRSLSASLDHMRELVMQQQAHASGSTVREPVSLCDQVELALRIGQDEGDGAIEIVRRFDADLPPVAVSKHRLLQVLVNLLKNARQSVRAASAGEKRIEIVLARTGSGVRVEVRDNGVGIAPEHLTRIFAHGFTTKSGGHGFGLHSAANAAREMGGSLVARSEGAGRGATFVLEIPVAEAAVAA